MQGTEAWEAAAQAVVLVQNVDAGIDSDAAQQDKRGKTSLVEIQAEKVEGQEDANV